MSVSLSPAWSTKEVLGQPGLHSNLVSTMQQEQINNTTVSLGAGEWLTGLDSLLCECEGQNLNLQPLVNSWAWLNVV